MTTPATPTTGSHGGDGAAAAARAVADNDDGHYPATHYTDEYDRGDGWVLHTEGHNLIVNDCRKLLAALFAGATGYAGVQYWAVGSGLATDSDSSPTPASPTDTRLRTEIARVPVTVSYLDDLGQPMAGAGISRVVRVQATFPEGTGTGRNLEFGLFGGNATSTVNSGLLIDRVVHQAKYKESTEARRLTIDFTF